MALQLISRSMTFIHKYIRQTQPIHLMSYSHVSGFMWRRPTMSSDAIHGSNSHKESTSALVNCQWLSFLPVLSTRQNCTLSIQKKNCLTYIKTCQTCQTDHVSLRSDETQFFFFLGRQNANILMRPLRFYNLREEWIVTLSYTNLTHTQFFYKYKIILAQKQNQNQFWLFSYSG